MFPCKPRGKAPLTPRGHNDASTDGDQIRRWWGRWPDANIGIATGAGLAVVDVDDEDGLDDLTHAHGGLPTTLEAVTGGGGRHLFFRCDGELRCRNGFGRGVDLKADGGYVIAPPSVHPSGAPYAWDTDDEGPGDPIAELPAWVRSLRDSNASRPATTAGAAGTADMERVREALAHICPDDYETWIRVGMALHHETGGGADGESLWRAWSSSSSKFDDKVQAKKWASFGRGEGRRTIATVFHFAREAGYRPPRPEAPEASGGDELPIFRVGDEQEVANWLLGRIEARGPAVSDQGSLWRYAEGSGLWEEIEDHTGRGMVGALWGAQVVRNVDEATGEVETKHWRIGKSTRENVWTILRQERTRPGFFDDAPAALMFADRCAVIDDAGGVRFESHRPGFRARVGYPFPFASAVCPRWRDTLAAWFDGDEDGEVKTRFLQEFAGACLFGLAPKYQRAVILYGTGGNGKSTCLDAIEAMFPREAVSHVAPHALMGSSAEYYLAELRGARLNVVRDMPSTSLLQSADFKAAVSGEPLMARPIGSAPFSFTPTAGHVFGANALPATTDQSTGFWRRWVVVPFTNRFEVARGTEDLASAIVRDELPGMVAWAVEGAANLTLRGRYVLPSSHADAVDVWASNVNPVKAWLEEACEVGEGKWTKAAALYQAHRAWCQDNGVNAVSSRKFASRLETLGVERSKRKGDRGFKAATISIH